MILCDEIEKSFPIIEKHCLPEDLYEFEHCNYAFLSNYHFGLGLWIRNNLLNENSRLCQLFIKSNIHHKDDMSSLIIRLFYIYLQNKEHQPKKYPPPKSNSSGR